MGGRLAIRVLHARCAAQRRRGISRRGARNGKYEGHNSKWIHTLIVCVIWVLIIVLACIISDIIIAGAIAIIVFYLTFLCLWCCMRSRHCRC